MQTTALIDQYPVMKSQLDEFLKERLNEASLDYLEEMVKLTNQIKNICWNKNSIKIKNKNIYINTKIRCVIPDFSNWTLREIVSSQSNVKNIGKEYSLLEGHDSELPTVDQLKEIRHLLKAVFADDNHAFAFVCTLVDEARVYIPENDAHIDLRNFFYSKIYPNLRVYLFPVYKLNSVMPMNLLWNYFAPLHIYPEGLSQKEMDLIDDLSALQNSKEQYVTYAEREISIKREKLLEDFIKNPEDPLFGQLHWKVREIFQQFREKGGLIDMGAVKKELLQCEKIRADIEPYEEKLLTDPNRGHWDLWDNQSESEWTVRTQEKLVARNPECDVNENGVIAIDFGTKSTIVVYQSDIEHSLPMGIGDGNLSKSPSMKRYENPTVMHFVNLDQFLQDYQGKKGRPKTKWNDLTISHTAVEQFSTSKSDEYYEYMHQIKQWAGQRKKQFRIQPHEGESLVLPPFLELGEHDVNPIELYAYYIGLYINNMRKGHGIFLDYYLSFPVTYEISIREKMIKSFENGLKKSLPEPILDNPELMKRFHVNGDISEPAAYAVCALQEYGFDPEGDEEVFYGIFDFGGGTTDFDFGLWKQSDKRRYDYAIENFGAGGDEYLGGENLLEMLAFEVFKKNQDFMGEHGYPFTLAPKCKEFLGSDRLLSDSQEAEKNMHNLMEAIRPYWEGDAARKGQDTSKKNWFDRYIDDILQKCTKSSFFKEIKDEIQLIKENYNIGLIHSEDATNSVLSILGKYDALIFTSQTEEDDELQFVITMYDREGKDHANETLSFSRKELDRLVEDTIRQGVKNFISALLLSYKNDKVRKPAAVNILLAGNSCKSPVVRKVFEEEALQLQESIKETYECHDTAGTLVEIFPPLGTEEAYQKMEQRGVVFERNNFEKPTGKTGVAFGLLQCRKGGAIERTTTKNTDGEIPFPFFIGWRSKKKFVIFEDKKIQPGKKGSRITTYGIAL